MPLASDDCRWLRRPAKHRIERAPHGCAGYAEEAIVGMAKIHDHKCDAAQRKRAQGDDSERKAGAWRDETEASEHDHEPED